MDFSKYPLEKLIFYLAAIVPGFMALLIFQLAAPGSFGWFFAMGFLGYRSKLAIILLVSFVVGYTLTSCLSSVLLFLGGAIGGAMATSRPYKPPETYAAAPWRDPRWRTVLKLHLGKDAPNDTMLISADLFALREQMLNALPQRERDAALLELRGEKINAEIDDGKWAQWYDHFHQLAIQSSERDWHYNVARGLSFNFEATGLYVLISAYWVPSLRHWWLMVPAAVWVFILISQQYGDVKRYTEKWSTLYAQITYLSELNLGEAAKRKAAGVG